MTKYRDPYVLADGSSGAHPDDLGTSQHHDTLTWGQYVCMVTELKKYRALGPLPSDKDAAPRMTERHVQYHLGPDVHNRRHDLDVVLETGEDGTLGVRVVGSAAQLIIQPRTNREVYITTLRPDRMPPKEARS